MTKEIGGILLGETQDTAKSAASSSTNTKKEGASFFDSLLSEASTDVSKEKSSLGSEEKKQNNATQKENPSLTQNQGKIGKSQDNASPENKDNALENKEVKTSQNKVEETEESQKNRIDNSDKKIKNEGSSFLDKLIVEAKKTLEEQEASNKSTAPIFSNDDVVDESSEEAKLKEPLPSQNLVEKTPLENEESETLDTEKVNVKDKNILDNITKISDNSKNRDEIIQRVVSHIENKENKVLNNSQNTTELKETKVPVVDTNTEEELTTTASKTSTQEKVITQPVSTKSNETLQNKDEITVSEKKLENTDGSKIIQESIKPSSSQKNELNAEKITVVPTLKEENNSGIESKSKENITSDKSNPINEKVAKELASLNTQTKDETVKVSKDSLESDKHQLKAKENNSLLDRLINEAKKEVTVKTDSALENLKNQKQEAVTPKNEVVSHIFLTNQKKSFDDVSNQNASIGKQIAQEATSLGDVKKAASVMNLNMKESSVDTEIRQDELKDNLKSSFLDRLAFNKNVVKEDLLKLATAFNSGVVDSSSINVVDEPVTINVHSNLAMTIQSRIIGAQQQMSSMMSDVARTMYENYKPPVTAFRINLNPGTLGSIAVMMKNDKENSLSISLNMSSSSTLDAMVDSQASLRAALAKNFNEGMNFSLDFNMDEQNSSEGSSFNQNSEKDNNSSSNDILETINNIAEETEEQTQYM